MQTNRDGPQVPICHDASAPLVALTAPGRCTWLGVVAIRVVPPMPPTCANGVEGQTHSRQHPSTCQRSMASTPTRCWPNSSPTAKPRTRSCRPQTVRVWLLRQLNTWLTFRRLDLYTWPQPRPSVRHMQFPFVGVPQRLIASTPLEARSVVHRRKMRAAGRVPGTLCRAGPLGASESRFGRYDRRAGTHGGSRSGRCPERCAESPVVTPCRPYGCRIGAWLFEELGPSAPRPVSRMTDPNPYAPT